MHISHKSKQELCGPDIVVLGCGNTLLGDDGFGPAVVSLLERMSWPENVQILDVGTSVRECLLDYLMAPELRPRVLLLVDATYREGLAPGALISCRPSELSACKVHDFSLHQCPTVNLLAELEQESGICVELILAQANTVPEEIAPGLTPAMKQAVQLAVKMILNQIGKYVTSFSNCTPVVSAERVS